MQFFLSDFRLKGRGGGGLAAAPVQQAEFVEEECGTEQQAGEKCMILLIVTVASAH